MDNQKVFSQLPLRAYILKSSRHLNEEQSIHFTKKNKIYLLDDLLIMNINHAHPCLITLGLQASICSVVDRSS